MFNLVRLSVFQSLQNTERSDALCMCTIKAFGSGWLWKTSTKKKNKAGDFVAVRGKCLNRAGLCKTSMHFSWHFSCDHVTTDFVRCSSHACLSCPLIRCPFPHPCELDQTQKQVMTTSVWSCSAWRQWQTCSPCRTSTAPLWRGARRLWRKQTSTSEWKSLLQGLF